MRRITMAILLTTLVAGCDKQAGNGTWVTEKSQALQQDAEAYKKLWAKFLRDSDGDGVPDWKEMLAGTNPLDKNDKPKDGNSDGVFDVFVGPQGQQGLQGPQGPAGATGPQGVKGDTGEQGLQGPKGDSGATGAMGPVGSMGATGPQGLTGATGPRGVKGDKGDTGATGQQGAKGDIGPTGPQGEMGPPGADCTKECPEGTNAHYISNNLMYCSKFVDFVTAPTQLQCVEECAKYNLPLAINFDLSLPCIANSNIYDVYKGQNKKYLVAPNIPSYTSPMFLPGWTVEIWTTPSTSVNLNFCEIVLMSGNNYFPYFFPSSASYNIVKKQYNSSCSGCDIPTGCACGKRP